MRLLIVVAVDAEARAIGSVAPATLVVGGVGRTNAAAATTESIIRHGPFDAVISAGVAGALPGGGLGLAEPVIASRCVYAEEGMIGPAGFQDIAGLGLALGDFPANAVPVDERLLQRWQGVFRAGPVATVATCSGTDAAAREIASRTGAVAEAMEGAAVVHAARRQGVAGAELRVISNTTGDRSSQQWDLRAALAALGPAVRRAVEVMAGGEGR
jgi:futalosine hydrolase